MSDHMAWAENSVRWLSEHHSVYVRGRASATWPMKLARALTTMGFRWVDSTKRAGMNKDSYDLMIDTVAGIWSQELHTEMVEFIAAGGLEAEEAAYTAERTLKEREAEAIRAGRDSVMVAPGEYIELEMDTLDQVENALTPHSQASPDTELEEILAAESAKLDPRYKVW